MGNPPNHYDGRTGGGRGRPQVAYTVDAKCVRRRDRRWGQGRHLPKDLFYRNPGLHDQER